MTLDTKKGMVSVKTYSPFLDKYLTEPEQEFELKDVDYK